MALTLIAGSEGDDLPGVDINLSKGVSGWLKSIPAVRDWITDQGDKTIHVISDEQELPEHLAPHSLTVPTDAAAYRWRDDAATA